MKNSRFFQTAAWIVLAALFCLRILVHLQESAPVVKEDVVNDLSTPSTEEVTQVSEVR